MGIGYIWLMKYWITLVLVVVLFFNVLVVIENLNLIPSSLVFTLPLYKHLYHTEQGHFTCLFCIHFSFTNHYNLTMNIWQYVACMYIYLMLLAYLIACPLLSVALSVCVS